MSAPSSSTHLVLVLLWSRDEPGRVGEVGRLPQRGLAMLGRGGVGRRVRFCRHRPGGAVDTGELQSARLSRDQLRIQTDGATVEVQSVGRRPLLVNQVICDRALLREGDLIEVEREVLLLLERRPVLLPGPAAAFPFGEPDEDGIVGESPAAWVLRARLHDCGEGGSHILLSGESGTGKELAARAIHRHGGGHGQLVARNAATFPEGLIDAELFGNIANYPNPGMPARPGAVGLAAEGTLFLDEIGELPQELQAHLLRVLDDGEYTCLGDARPRVSRFRAIGATNRSLDVLKHDLLARFPRHISLPGLSERRSDIPLLAQHLLQQIARDEPLRFAGAPPRLHLQLVYALLQHPYTVHVRELQQQLWQVLEEWTLSGGKYLWLPDHLIAPSRRPESMNRAPGGLSRAEVLAAYRRFSGVQARVVEHFRLRNRFQLNRIEQKLGITAEDKATAVAEH